MRRRRSSSSAGGNDGGSLVLSWVTHALSPRAVPTATAGAHVAVPTPGDTTGGAGGCSGGATGGQLDDFTLAVRVDVLTGAPESAADGVPRHSVKKPPPSYMGDGG